MSIKVQLLELCNQHVNKRIQDYKNEIDLIKESIESNDKVSNEEDDSGNSKLLNDLEKNMTYLHDAQKMREQLQLIRPNLVSENAVLGSIVKTDSLSFFIAISMGKVVVDNKDYFVISMASPIGQLVKLKSKGFQFECNGSKYTITEVL